MAELDDNEAIAAMVMAIDEEKLDWPRILVNRLEVQRRGLGLQWAYDFLEYRLKKLPDSPKSVERLQWLAEWRQAVGSSRSFEDLLDRSAKIWAHPLRDGPQVAISYLFRGASFLVAPDSHSRKEREYLMAVFTVIQVIAVGDGATIFPDADGLEKLIELYRSLKV